MSRDTGKKSSEVTELYDLEEILIPASKTKPEELPGDPNHREGRQGLPS